MWPVHYDTKQQLTWEPDTTCEAGDAVPEEEETERSGVQGHPLFHGKFETSLKTHTHTHKPRKRPLGLEGHKMAQSREHSGYTLKGNVGGGEVEVRNKSQLLGPMASQVLKLEVSGLSRGLGVQGIPPPPIYFILH